MSRGLKIKLIVLALLLELVVLSLFPNPYPHGEAWDVSWHRQERSAAFFDYVQHQSPTTKAAWEQELRSLHRHEDWKTYLALSLLVAINGGAIYFFLHHERKTTTG
jgi:hypothetical protein